MYAFYPLPLAGSFRRPLLQPLSHQKSIDGGIGSSARSKNIVCMSASVPFPILRLNKDLALSPNAKDKNFSFSPGSIQLALSLLTNGATGTTLKELLTVLEANDLHQLNSMASNLIQTFSGLELSFAGGAWVHHSFDLNPDFKDNVRNIYRAAAKEMDFHQASQVIGEVNKWAEESTKGLIQSLLPPNCIKELTKIVLANAIYFRGRWAKQFRKSLTRNRKFYLLDGSSVKVPFMSSNDDQYINSFEDFKVLRLPYKNSTLSMYIFLPNEDDGLWPLVHKMGSDPLFLEKYALENTKAVEVDKFRIPKFEITCNLEVSKFLEDIGLHSCFSEKAEFTEMVTNLTPGDWIEVQEVYQKSYIKIDEKGTEASAVTAMVECLGACALRPQPVPPLDFVADHPFMFMIRDDMSEMILFTGHVVNPLVNDNSF